MEPRISKHERKLRLSYEVPHRIHCSSIYPVPTPNGSSMLLYGYEDGLRILWRGGRRPRAPAPAQHRQKTNGSSGSRDVTMLDGDEEDEHGDDHESEEADDEQDTDCPFPPITGNVDIVLDASVVRLAVPSFPSGQFEEFPITQSHAIVALVCSNSRIRLLTLPLAPPTATDTSGRDYIYQVGEVEINTDGCVASDVCVKLATATGHNDAATKRNGAGVPHSRLLIAAGLQRLSIWSVKITGTSLSVPKEMPCPDLRLQPYGSKLSFNSSSRSATLLFADRSGVVRIYELAPTSPDDRPVSRESNSSISPGQRRLGKVITSYLSPYNSQNPNTAATSRKKILGAAWVLGGRSVLVLLEDGEWGVWNVSGPTTQKETNVQDFTLHGFLDSPSTSTPENLEKKPTSKLAPMTPNTRKARSKNLFGTTSKAPGSASTGGISVISTTNRSGQSDESVIMWYNGAVYSIPSFHTFWQRSMNSGSGIGSLYAPGLTQVSDLDLMNENITSISQVPPSSQPAGSGGTLGHMNVSRDLLVSAEHRFVVLQSLRRQTSSSGGLFQQQITERPAPYEQKMLDAGELDLDGVDRVLEVMADARSRRVGFASS